MKLLSRISYFFAGAFLTNSVPHFIIAATGRHNLTPFGRDSSPQVNLLWGLINLGAGYALMRTADRQERAGADSKEWQVPYEMGCLFWSSFGVCYSLYSVVFKKGEQDKA
jgi:hypothetical protein